ILTGFQRARLPIILTDMAAFGLRTISWSTLCERHETQVANPQCTGATRSRARLTSPHHPHVETQPCCAASCCAARCCAARCCEPRCCEARCCAARCCEARCCEARCWGARCSGIRPCDVLCGRISCRGSTSPYVRCCAPAPVFASAHSALASVWI